MADGLPENFPTLVVEGCPDAIIYADATGAIRYWNAAATRIFGYSTEEAMGQSLDLIIPERLRGRHWEGWNRVMGGSPSRYPDGALLAVPGARKDGSPLSIEFTILPVTGADGKLAGITAFLRDGTQRFDEMRALRRELAALKSA